MIWIFCIGVETSFVFFSFFFISLIWWWILLVLHSLLFDRRCCCSVSFFIFCLRTWVNQTFGTKDKIKKRNKKRSHRAKKNVENIVEKRKRERGRTKMTRKEKGKSKMKKKKSTPLTHIQCEYINCIEICVCVMCLFCADREASSSVNEFFTAVDSSRCRCFHFENEISKQSIQCSQITMIYFYLNVCLFRVCMCVCHFGHLPTHGKSNYKK